MSGDAGGARAEETAQELEFRARQIERQIGVQIEQVKLRATGLNLIAVGFVVTGIIGPIGQIAAGIVDKTITGQALAVMAIWFLMAFILHYGALLALRSLP